MSMSNRKSVQSTKSLQSEIHKGVKSVFTCALECIEIKFGKDFDGYDAVRKKILDVGNEAIRRLYKIVEEEYIIEKRPDMVTIKFGNGRAKGD